MYVDANGQVHDGTDPQGEAQGDTSRPPAPAPTAPTAAKVLAVMAAALPLGALAIYFATRRRPAPASSSFPQ